MHGRAVRLTTLKGIAVSEIHLTEPPAAADEGLDFCPIAGPGSDPNSCPLDCPLHKTRGALWGIAGWLGAALAAVFVATVPYDPGEKLCGVWGCFPPLAAVASMHLIWCVILGATVWAVHRWAPALLRPLGFVLVLAALGAAAALVGTDLTDWLSKVSADARRFWPRRLGYRVVTLTDVPVVQALVVGAACAIFGRSQAASGRPVGV